MFGSKTWTAGESQFAALLGEDLDTEQKWASGRIPNPFPSPVRIGSDDCIGYGETDPLPNLLTLTGEDVAGEPTISGNLPDLLIGYPAGRVDECSCILWAPDSELWWDLDSCIEWECPAPGPDCSCILWAPDSELWWDLDSCIEWECEV